MFVLFQIFNEINARKLKPSEVNVFENFFNNPMFIIILVGTIIIQLVMVKFSETWRRLWKPGKFGGKSLKTVELSTIENLLCVFLGASSLLAGLVIKLVFPENLIVSLQGV